MKKDFKNPENQKTDLKRGDGFIRVGQGTEKLSREDFDQIYQNKYELRDRRDDLKIRSYCAEPEKENLEGLDLKCIDLAIENTSNKSIHFDIEMTVLKDDRYSLFTEDDLNQMIQKQKMKHLNTGFIRKYSLTPPIINPNIYFIDNEDSVEITRNLMSAKGTAVSIAQNSTESEIFFKHLYVLIREKDCKSIKAQLTVKCDDFTGGLLSKEVIFNCENGYII